MGSTSFEIAPVKQPKAKIDPQQKKFSRLSKKVEALQNRQRSAERGFDEALKYYHDHMRGLEQRVALALADRSKITFLIYQSKNPFTKTEKKVLKQMILDDVETVFRIQPPAEVPPELKQIFKTLTGTDFDKVASNEFGEMKADLEEMFKEKGLDIDLSGIDMMDREEEMVDKMFRSMFDAMSDQEDVCFKKQKINQKTSLKQQQMEEAQNKSIHTLYKQLAKAFHPDLEQDVERKKEKEELMKRVTAAYENKDLHELLAIEMEWIRSSSAFPTLPSMDQLKIYNEILEEQVKDLEMEIELLMTHPKYFSIQRFYPDHFTDISTIKVRHLQLQEDLTYLESVVQKLKSPYALQMIHQGIRETMQDQHHF